MIQRENDGVRWELQPDFAPLLDEVLKSPGEMVKESSAKRVTRHHAKGNVFYVKRYLHHSVPLRSFKFFFKPSQARQEWTLAQKLEARGIPIVRHVALGERRSWSGAQESILVTEGFAGVEVSQVNDIDPLTILKFVQQMHERGVVQEDLHLGNLLVIKDPFELRLVDLHGTRVERRLSQQDRLKNLALLRIFLPVPVSAEVLELSRQLRRAMLFERSKRCFFRNREFTRIRAGGLNWQVRVPFCSPAVERILSDPDGFLESRATMLKTGRTSTVGAADGLVLKRFNLRKLENLLKDLFRSSLAHRAFRKSYHLELVGIPTARSIATVDRRFFGFRVRSYLLMEEIRGAVDLMKYFRDGGKPGPKLVQDAARLIAELHEEGFSHRDLKESNLVLDGEGELHLIDLDGMTFLQNVPDARAALDLARLDLGVARYPAVTAKHRILFLLAYCRSRGIKRIPRIRHSPRQRT